MSNAIWTGLTSSGNSFSDAKSSTLNPFPIVIFWIVSVPLHEHVRATGALAGLVGLRVDEGRASVSSTLRSSAARHGPDAPIAIADHQVEHGHLALQDFVVGGQDVFLGDLGHLIRH